MRRGQRDWRIIGCQDLATFGDEIAFGWGKVRRGAIQQKSFHGGLVASSPCPAWV
jgi:urease alpha subunit